MTCQDCAPLQQENTRLREALNELEQENAGLRRRLLVYENPHTPPSRRLVYPKPKRLADAPRYPGRPRGHRGVTRPRPQPDVVLEPPRKTRCEDCGSPLGEPTEVGHRVVEEIGNPAPRRVIDYLEHEWMCEACGEYTSSRHPDCPPLGRLGKNALVQATLLKFQDRLPLRKAAEALRRTYGLTVTPATVLDITRRVAWWIRPEYGRILQRIRASGVVYVDETSFRVDGKKHWIWAFTTETDTLIVVRKSRGKRVLEEVLGKGFKGVVVCDGWSSYRGFTDLIQRCWSHLLREADHLAEQGVPVTHLVQGGPHAAADAARQVVRVTERPGSRLGHAWPPRNRVVQGGRSEAGPGGHPHPVVTRRGCPRAAPSAPAPTPGRTAPDMFLTTSILTNRGC